MKLEKYINQIISAIEGTPHEIEELRAELTGYLNDKQASYQKKGATAEEALAQTMTAFGNPTTIGANLAATIFPQRKWLLLLLSFFAAAHLLLTLLVTLIPYNLTRITDQGILFPIWLGLNGVILLGNYQFYRKRLLIARFRPLFFLHCLLCLLSLTYTLPLFFDGPASRLATFSQVFVWVYLLAIVGNLVVGALVKPIQTDFANLQPWLRVTLISTNTFSGLFALSYSLLMGFGILYFGGGTLAFELYYWMPFILLGVWIGSLTLNNYFKKTWGLGLLLQLVVVGYIGYMYWFFL